MMSGAQLSEGLPKRGQLMRDFVLSSASGERVQLSEYRGKKNLVAVVAGRQLPHLLHDLADRQDALRDEQAQVLIVVFSSPAEVSSPFTLLCDPDGVVHAHMGATTDAPALYITDRFGEVFAAFRTAEGDTLPSASEVLDWLGFVNRQCEECYPPEWPA